MPLKFHKKIENSPYEIGVWAIDEPPSFFEDGLELIQPEQEQLDAIKGRRKLEWLASRYLLHKMSGRAFRGAILKDDYGKPFLTQSSFQISLSHSRKMTAAIAGPTPVGIDIQIQVPKIERISHKFIHEEEFNFIEERCKMDYFHVLWGAKESLYKAYGRRQLEFIENIRVDAFIFDEKGGETTGHVIKDTFRNHFKIQYQKINEYYLVHAFVNE